MAADDRGNDLGAVGIPIDGSLGFAPGGTLLPTSEEGSFRDFKLPAAYKRAGLFTEDGGFEWNLEADGDPIKFFQQGYTIPSGLANAELTVKLAQYDPITQLISWGKVPDENGYITIDAGGHALSFAIFTEEIFKNGTIRRRAAEATVKSAKVDKAENGSVNGTEVVFSAKRLPSLNNEHLGEWLLPRGFVSAAESAAAVASAPAE
jgi:hypothetical protein